MRAFETMWIKTTKTNNKMISDTHQEFIKILENPEEKLLLMEVAASFNLENLVLFYERYKIVCETSKSIKNLIEQQYFRKIMKDLGREFLFENAINRLPIPWIWESSTPLKKEIMECGSSTIGNSADLSCLDPVLASVLNIFQDQLFPEYYLYSAEVSFSTRYRSADNVYSTTRSSEVKELANSKKKPTNSRKFSMQNIFTKSS